MTRHKRLTLVEIFKTHARAALDTNSSWKRKAPARSVIRDASLIFRDVFSWKTKAPARNVIRDALQMFRGVLSWKTKAPARKVIRDA